jgi:hypothetical protein
MACMERRRMPTSPCMPQTLLTPALTSVPAAARRSLAVLLSLPSGTYADTEDASTTLLAPSNSPLGACALPLPRAPLDN